MKKGKQKPKQHPHNVVSYINQFSKQAAPTAKLDRDFIFQFGKGNINLTKNALNYLLVCIRYVGKDGRIFLDEWTFRNEVAMQHITYKRVINELVQNGLIRIENEIMYSNFHVLSSGKNGEKSYLRSMEVLTSAESLSLSKSEKRFFMYIAAAGIQNGSKLHVAIESLYSNKYQTGVDYFESFKELAAVVVKLVSKGLIEVQIEKKIYTNKDKDFEADFHAFCGSELTNRKKRMTKQEKHVIGFSVARDHINQITKNEAGRKEIEQLAVENYLNPINFRDSTIPLFLSVQNELYNLLGIKGVALYRAALTRYFQTEQMNVYYHDILMDENQSKAINTMVDFYLLEDIKMIIIESLTNSDGTDADTFFNDKYNLSILVHYFLEKGSSNHKILLDEALEENSVDLAELALETIGNELTVNPWKPLYEQIATLYATVPEDDTVISIETQKEIVRYWAKEGILTRKNTLLQSVEKLKQKVSLLNSKKPEPATCFYDEVSYEKESNNEKIKDVKCDF